MSCSCLRAGIAHFPQRTNAPSARVRPATTNATEVPTASADTRDSRPDVPTAAHEVPAAVHVSPVHVGHESAMGDKATLDSVAATRSVRSSNVAKIFRLSLEAFCEDTAVSLHHYKKGGFQDSCNDRKK